MSKVAGFKAYYLVKIEGGFFTITVCEGMEGIDESNRIAAEWIGAKATGAEEATPQIWSGETPIALTGSRAAVSV